MLNKNKKIIGVVSASLIVSVVGVGAFQGPMAGPGESGFRGFISHLLSGDKAWETVTPNSPEAGEIGLDLTTGDVNSSQIVQNPDGDLLERVEFIQENMGQDLATVLTEGNDADGKTITNLPLPIASTDAATMEYVDAAGGSTVTYKDDDGDGWPAILFGDLVLGETKGPMLYTFVGNNGDCDDNDVAIKAASDGTCDGDGDGFIDWTAGGDDFQDDQELVQGKLVFVTSESYNGNLGGVTGAQAICTTLAEEAELSGRWKAWIASSASDDPESTFTRYTMPIQLLDGTKIADNWTDLTDMSLDSAINVNEYGIPVSNAYVWSDVSSNGGIRMGGSNCTLWSNGSSGAWYAWESNRSDGGWTYSSSPGCNLFSKLYCFQQ